MQYNDSSKRASRDWDYYFNVGRPQREFSDYDSPEDWAKRNAAPGPATLSSIRTRIKQGYHLQPLSDADFDALRDRLFPKGKGYSTHPIAYNIARNRSPLDLYSDGDGFQGGFASKRPEWEPYNNDWYEDELARLSDLLRAQKGLGGGDYASRRETSEAWFNEDGSLNSPDFSDEDVEEYLQNQYARQYRDWAINEHESRKAAQDRRLRQGRLNTQQDNAKRARQGALEAAVGPFSPLLKTYHNYKNNR